MRHLGTYLLHEPLGRGASGEVWRASVPDGNGGPAEEVAVKVLHPELTNDPEAVARFLQERTALTGIESPFVVPVRDVVVAGDDLAVVMDLAPGVDLRRLLQASPTQPPGLACRLAAQVAAGLAAVHAAGVVHRDVKPENVLVDLAVPGAPHARLTDFGVARLAAGPAAIRSTRVVGTPEYLAPELAESGDVSPAADVYSLGILLYELCCGRTPFAGGHPLAVLRRHAEEPPPRPAALPAPLWGLVAWMLSKAPEARPSAEDAAEALDDLAEALADRPALVPMSVPVDPDAGGVATAGSASGDGAAHAPVALPTETRPRPFRAGSGRRPGRGGRGSRARRPPGRALLFAAPLALLLGAVIALGWVRSGSPPPDPYRFAPFELDNGLAVERTWRFADDEGSALLGYAEVHNRSAAPFTGAFDEVLPRSLAEDLDGVDRDPKGDSPANPAGDPVLRFAITDLDPGYFWRISYRVDVPAEGTGRDRLKRWAADQREAFERWGLTDAGRQQGVPNRLVSFEVDAPDPFRLPEGAEYQLALAGRLEDGSAASPGVLALVRWTSADVEVAIARSGLVRAVGEGTTELRAEADELEGWSGSVEVVGEGEAEVPPTTFDLGTPSRAAPNAPAVESPIGSDPPGTDDGPGRGQQGADGPVCADSEDNDGDGRIDLGDAGCSSSDDDSEGGDTTLPPRPACDNGVDDDGDSRVDGADAGCSSGTDDDEGDEPPPACANGVDDDGDGAVDLDDGGCGSATDDDEAGGPPVPACDNGVDDDGDDVVDLDDAGCSSATDDDEGDGPVAACANGLDDDGDGAVDLDDTGCESAADDDESGGVGAVAACANGTDDDGDGFTDLDDAGCASEADDDEADDRTESSTTLPGPTVPPPDPDPDPA